MTVQTLGRVAYDTWSRVAGYRRNWDSPALSPAAKEPWEQAAKAVAAKVLEHFKEAPAPEQETYTRFGQERARQRQGGMVNVHTKPPAHYNAHPSGVECIEVTRHLPFNLGNVVKYIWRAGLKENESEIKDLEKSLDYLNDEINKRKLALGLAPSYRFETQLDARVPEHRNFRCIVTPIEFEPLRTDNQNPNARCKSPRCDGRTTYDARTGGAKAFVRMPYYYCLACLVRFGELNADGSHKLASGDR